MGEARRDQNHVTTLLAVSSVDGETPVPLWADPITHRLLVEGSGGSGDVTIGNPVVGGTPTDILFVDDSGNLGQSDDFQWEQAGTILHINGEINFRSGITGIITIDAPADPDASGDAINIMGGNATGTGTGGLVQFLGGFDGSGLALGGAFLGRGGTNTKGGDVEIGAGGFAGTGDGGDAYISGGNTQDGLGGSVLISGGSPSMGDNDGGNITLLPGTKSGAGNSGHIMFQDADSLFKAIFDTSLLAANRTYTFPDQSGTIALFSDIPAALALEVEGTPNVDQTLLNLLGGTNMTITDNGDGSVTFDVSGGGDVFKVGTPADNQVAVWTGDGTIEGTAALTFNTSTLTLGSGAANGIVQSNGNFDLVLQTGNVTTGSITIADGANGDITIDPNGTGDVIVPGSIGIRTVNIHSVDATTPSDISVIGGNATSGNNTGGGVDIFSGNGFGSGQGGNIDLSAGSGGATDGKGGKAFLVGGEGGGTNGAGGGLTLYGGGANGSGLGGDIEIFGGESGSGDGGFVYIYGGNSASGTDGHVVLGNPGMVGIQKIGSTLEALLDASNIASTDKTFTFPNASGTLALTTSTVAVATAITVANEATDTTCFILFATAATGDLGAKSNVSLTFNSNTGVLTSASSVLTTTDINGGTIDGTVIGGSSAAAATITTLIITSFGANWTNAGRTVADLGIVTTVDINGGTVDGTVIGGSSAAAGTFTAAIANSFVPNSSTIPSNGLYLPAGNTLGWAINSAAEMQLTSTALSPAVDGGSSLGTTALGWQNLFGNTGFVLNIENGDWVATHTAGILTVGTGDLRVTNNFTNAASVVTVGGAQTLTNKTLTSPTLTTPSAFTTGGTITLAENTSIALDPAGSADGKYTGITVTATSGYTQAFGDLVYIDPTDSRWEATDANSAAGADGDARGILGMVVVAGNDGAACTILLQGIIRADANFPSFTVNNPVYVSETSGDVTQTQPTTTDAVIRVVGFALTADEMYFCPSGDYITHT